jgi:hypothetical protein
MVLVALACHRPAPPPPADGTDGTGHTGTHAHHGDHSGHSGDSGAEPPPTFLAPALLSEAGLYDDLPGRVLADGVVETTPRYPLWSDGSDKRRWLRVPDGARIDTSDPDQWVFPVGTLAFKEFARDGVVLETRRLEKRVDGWDMIAYLWREDGTDADAVPAGAADVAGTAHDVPSIADCRFCHVGPADLVLGVDAIQTDAALQAALPLSAPVAAEIPGDEPTRAALGYLHGNCGSCHREGALAGTRTGLWLDVAAGLTDPSLSAAAVTGIGAPTNHEIGGTTVSIAPGDPAASQLWVRMGLRDLEAMPPRGSEVVDVDGMATIEAWIRSLEP